MLDHYWLETAEFVRARLGRSHAVVGPPEFMGALPQITPYESCTLQLLEDRCHFIIHKGMADQIYQPFLYTAMLAGALVFSNDVFLVVDIPGADGAGHMQHARSFVETLAQRRAGTALTMPTARSPSCYLGNSRAICTTVHGHKMIVDTNDLSLTPHLLTEGYWEDWVTAFIKRTVQPGWHVVEVGANVGYYTVLMADLVGATGFVTAFEANRAIANLLADNLEINGFRTRSHVQALAVSNTGGNVAEFKIFRRHAGSSGLFATDELAARFGDQLLVESVMTTTLDECLEAEAGIDFIKVDAEGAEPLILAGAKRLISENKNIQLVIEFAPSNVSTIMEPREFLERLRSLGFRIHRIDEDSRTREADLGEIVAKWHSELYLART